MIPRYFPDEVAELCRQLSSLTEICNSNSSTSFDFKLLSEELLTLSSSRYLASNLSPGEALASRQHSNHTKPKPGGDVLVPVLIVCTILEISRLGLFYSSLLRFDPDSVHGSADVSSASSSLKGTPHSVKHSRLVILQVAGVPAPTSRE